MNAPRVTNLIRSIMETCVFFAGSIERWGGDVLPELLSEGSTEDKASKPKESELLRERSEVVTRIVVVSWRQCQRDRAH